MTRHPGVDAWAQIVPDDGGRDEQVDRAKTEATYNTRLPSAYMAFMSRYGGGSLTAVPGVLLPLPQQGIQWDPGSLAEETANARLRSAGRLLPVSQHPGHRWLAFATMPQNPATDLSSTPPSAP